MRVGFVRFWIVMCLTFASGSVFAVSVNSIFQSNMVLPHSRTIRIFGSGAENEPIRVAPSWGVPSFTTVGADGKWSVEIQTPGPQQESVNVTIDGYQSILLSNIAIGDVWICLGQSNMEHRLDPTPGLKDILNAQDEIANANYPNLRLLYLSRIAQTEPATSINNPWTSTTPNTVKTFSGVGYFFARELHTSTRMPIGIIAAVRGACSIEDWIPNEDLVSLNSSYKPTTTYFNGMLAPFVHFPVKGVIAWIGETNVNRPNEFATVWPAMVRGFRKQFGFPIPFYYVQLQPMNYSGGRKGNGALSRASQNVIQNWPNVAVATIQDIVDDINDIHPVNKQEVARRLARLALQRTYNSSVRGGGPWFESFRLEGASAKVNFRNVFNGLSTNGSELFGFEVGNDSGVWIPASGAFTRGTVTLNVPIGFRPTAIRYEWSDTMIGNLRNSLGEPAAPFRTDILTPAWDR
jgi:sialate O-acetylesterase